MQSDGGEFVSGLVLRECTSIVPWNRGLVILKVNMQYINIAFFLH